LQRPHSENPIPKIPSIFELNPPVGSSQLDLYRWFSSISINWWYIYILIYGTIWFSYGFPMVFLSKDPKKPPLSHWVWKPSHEDQGVSSGAGVRAAHTADLAIWRFFRSAKSRGFWQRV
jgi:hypothetical protein